MHRCLAVSTDVCAAAANPAGQRDDAAGGCCLRSHRSGTSSPSLYELSFHRRLTLARETTAIVTPCRFAVDPMGTVSTRSSAAPVTRTITYAGLHMPPGAPGWHLPPPAMPMIWEGLPTTSSANCSKIQSRTGTALSSRSSSTCHTPLVLWGWHPGEGRTPIPIPLHEFLAKVRNGLQKEQPVPEN